MPKPLFTDKQFETAWVTIARKDPPGTMADVVRELLIMTDTSMVYTNRKRFREALARRVRAMGGVAALLPLSKPLTGAEKRQRLQAVLAAPEGIRHEM